jgi:hypothetical protein
MLHEFAPHPEYILDRERLEAEPPHPDVAGEPEPLFRLVEGHRRHREEKPGTRNLITIYKLMLIYLAVVTSIRETVRSEDDTLYILYHGDPASD